MKIKVVVLCENSQGEREFYMDTVHCSQEAYDNGDHYDEAKSAAELFGYKPLAVFDKNDQASKQIVELLQWLSK